MTIRVQLLVSEWCAPCRSAEEVWRGVAQQKAIAFEVLDVGQPEGRTVVRGLGIRTVPATVVDGELRCVGVPTPKEALALVASAPDRESGASSTHYVGLALESTSRWAIVSSAAYLALGGAALVLGGGIAGDAPWRAAALHAFGLGFAAFMIFGLGEHLLPRFTGAPIVGGRLAWVQFAAAHAGVVLLVAGFATHARGLQIAGGVLAWAAFALFALRMVPVLVHGAPTENPRR